MIDFAILGGTGLTTLQNLEIVRRAVMTTPYGEPSAALSFGRLEGAEVVFLARHGDAHTIPPHRVNYRANLWALREAGCGRVISVCAVGGIREDIVAGTLVIPDQIIDYTWSRAHTFFDRDLEHVTHVDFTRPYCEALRADLIAAAGRARIDVIRGATYGATQGPRLESAAEIDRLERDGCHIVGMTGMPEAALARELELCYAACAVCANPAAGRGGEVIEISAILANIEHAMARVRSLLEEVITR